MTKRGELFDSDSNWNRARDDEQMFILLGRDRAAPGAIRQWIAERIRLGLNKPTDASIQQAVLTALLMEQEHGE